MQLVVCATAAADVCRVAVDAAGGSRETRDRYDKELARIARASLFKPASPEGARRQERRETRTKAEKPR